MKQHALFVIDDYFVFCFDHKRKFGCFSCQCMKKNTPYMRVSTNVAEIIRSFVIWTQRLSAKFYCAKINEWRDWKPGKFVLVVRACYFLPFAAPLMPTAIICSAFIFDFDLYWLRFGSPPLFLLLFAESFVHLWTSGILSVNCGPWFARHACQLLIDRFL